MEECNKSKEVPSTKQVQETLEKLNPSKATAYDKIDPRILKIGGGELQHHRLVGSSIKA